MRIRFSALQVILAFAAFIPCCFLANTSSSQPISRGRPIEFSTPKNVEAATNLHEFNNKKSEFKTFEADRFKGFGQGSLDGFIMPAMPSGSGPVIQSKKVRELMDQKKNWIFMNPDEQGANPSAESIFNLSEYGPDGQEKKKGTLLEQFIERQQAGAKTDKGKTDPAKERERKMMKSEKDSSEDEMPIADDPNLPEGIRQSQQYLKKQISSSESTSSDSIDSSTRSSLSDFFGSVAKESGRDRNAVEKPGDAITKQYHPLSSSSSTMNSLKLFESLGTGTGLNAPPTQPTSLDSLTQTRRLDGPEGIASSISPSLTTPSLPDVNTRALTQWNPMTPSVPQYEPPKIAPIVTIPEFPRRKF